MKILILFVLSALVLPPAAAAQASQLGPVRVTLVAGPVPAKGGRAEVVRRANRAPRDLVIVGKNASAIDLAAALVTLNALRSSYGDTITTDVHATAETVRPGKKWDKSDYHNWLTAQLVRLRSAKPAPFADLGIVSAVQITLPAPQGTVTSASQR